jgi:hypothetical protein
MKRVAFSFIIFFIIIFSCAKGPKIEFPDEVMNIDPDVFEKIIKGVPIFDVDEYKFIEDDVTKRAQYIFTNNPVAGKTTWEKVNRKSDDESIIFQADSIQFEVAKPTGAEILMNLSRYTCADGGQKELEKDQLEEISKQYIIKYFPEINLKELHFKTIKKIMDSTARLLEEGKKVTDVQSQIANYITIFERQLNDIPVLGPGSKIRVYLSNDKEIIGHSIIWRKIQEKKGTTKPAVDISEIRKIFIEKHKRDKVKNIKVDELYFGYFEDGRYNLQSTLVPIYMVGFVYGDWSKRVFEMYDAYTGKEIRPYESEEGDEKK